MPRWLRNEQERLDISHGQQTHDDETHQLDLLVTENRIEKSG